MAVVTPVLREVLLRDLPLVYVIVAIHAGGSQISELPFFTLEMAGKTRGGQMGAIQGESQSGMILKRKETAFKTIFRMAFSAVWRDIVSGEFPLVIICMTSSTCVMGKRFGQTFLMTIPAIYLLMFAKQNKLSQSVIEIVQIVDQGKRLLLMAFGTSGSKLSFVHILVALYTIRRLNTRSVGEQGTG